MTAHELLTTLHDLEVRLVANGDRLQVDAPVGVVTPELRAAIAARKTELVALLAERQPPYELNEFDELSPVEPPPTSSNSLNSYDETRAAAEQARVLARWRTGLSKGLRHWEDERLVALAMWHLALAFSRVGAVGLRRHLPRSLAALTDDELVALVDWPSLASLETTLWASDERAAAQLSRGAQHLAAWYNAHRAATRKAAASTSVAERRDQRDSEQLALSND